MSVQGPSSLPFVPFPGTTPSIARPAARPAAAAAAAPAATTPAAPAAAKAAAAPAESSLWDLLTTEERDFFSQQASLGALTYGRAGAAGANARSTRSATTAPLGQRLDVRG